MDESKKLKKKIIYQGKIKALTGLHIGGTNSAMGIGGPDSFVVRNPLTKEPYIPGSSIKGKMRSLLEIMDGTIGGAIGTEVQHGPSENPEARSVKLHGTAKKNHQRPSRLQVRDAHMNLTKGNKKVFEDTDLLYTETKTEVVIDRITSVAMPRTIERVPAGVEFELNMVLNVFDKDDEDELKSALDLSIKLLEDDYLGGSGSRGYGQVEIVIEKIEERTVDSYAEMASKLIDGHEGNA